MSNKSWTIEAVEALYQRPLMDLLFEAQTVHRKHFNPNEVELCTLLSIKTGACPEDCGYCSQSGHHNTGLKKEKLMAADDIIKQAKIAQQNGATRFCMGAAWRCPPDKEIPNLVNIIKSVKELGLETCMTLGMLNEKHVADLEAAGLDYYNHNLDTSSDYYTKITSTRTYQDRLDTLSKLEKSTIKICCGGIVGMGETREDRIKFLIELTNLAKAPESVPINRLIPIPGTPLAEAAHLDNIEFIRTVAIARILLPTSMVRLSAGRTKMSEEMQALCFMAGANSIHMGEKLLTTPNPSHNQDMQLFQKLGITAKEQCNHHAQPIN